MHRKKNLLNIVDRILFLKNILHTYLITDKHSVNVIIAVFAPEAVIWQYTF